MFFCSFLFQTLHTSKTKSLTLWHLEDSEKTTDKSKKKKRQVITQGSDTPAGYRLIAVACGQLYSHLFTATQLAEKLAPSTLSRTSSTFNFRSTAQLFPRHSSAPGSRRTSPSAKVAPDALFEVELTA